jgi:hypothetical protein
MYGLYRIMANIDPKISDLEWFAEVIMAFAFTFWLGRLWSSTSGGVSFPPSAQRKPMEIEVERLPDYLWRDLGFQQPRCPDGE